LFVRQGDGSLAGETGGRFVCLIRPRQGDGSLACLPETGGRFVCLIRPTGRGTVLLPVPSKYLIPFID